MEFVFCWRRQYNSNMGNCVSPNNRLPFSSTVLGKMRQVLTTEQLYLLHLIYFDLAQRTVERSLNLENFLLFFHKNGLWGQQLFCQFGSEQTGFLSEEEFVCGIARISKSPEVDKISLLFKFFSRGNCCEGVPFSEFVTMLYNYPKQDLRLILNDREFIEFQLKKRMVLQERSNKNGMDYNTYCLESSSSIQFQSKSNISSRDIRLPSLISRQVIKGVKNNNQTVLSFTDGNQVCQIITTNIQQLVKKFAHRIFYEAGIDPRDGKLTFNQFSNWVQAHKALYRNYYQGLHHLVWQLDKTINKPRYLIEVSEKISSGRLILGERRVPVRLFLQHSLLVICEEDHPERPLCVVCLDGLTVHRCYSSEDGFGFQITHRDGIYSEKRIFLRDQALLLEWMDLLKFYRGETIQQKYEIGAKIGTGKFSVVYRCQHLNQHRPYALKEIATYKLQPEARNLIAHQSSIMRVVSHPLLLQFKECLQTRSHIYIVTELVDGCDLFEFVKQREFLSEYDAAKITQQIIVGIRFLHSLEIVHRDLKPENIMVVMDQQKVATSIKVIDFGFSTYLSHLERLPPEERIVGTPNYIAPEVLKEDHLGFQIDNFAIGVTLFFMLTGELPFNDYNLANILENTVHGIYQFPDRHALSKQCMDLTSRLLENNPQERISLEQALKHPWFQILKEARKPTKLLKGKDKAPFRFFP